jgi:hypothetical protein
MRSRKKLIKDALSLFVTLGITAISASATDALPLKENTQKGANAVSNCIRNTKQKPTSLKVNQLVSNGNKQVPTSDCWACHYNSETQSCYWEPVSCRYPPRHTCNLCS